MEETWEEIGVRSEREIREEEEAMRAGITLAQQCPFTRAGEVPDPIMLAYLVGFAAGHAELQHALSHGADPDDTYPDPERMREIGERDARDLAKISAEVKR